VLLARVSLRTLIWVLLPGWVLEAYRKWRKAQVRQDIQQRIEVGTALDQETLVQGLRSMGLENGQSLLVHSSLSSIGAVLGGAPTVIDALQEAIGPSGTLMMPSSPVAALQAEFVRNRPVFNLRSTPSAMGAITEQFRQRPGTQRSLHPTEPVCAMGPWAKELTAHHHTHIRPYADQSPWRKWMELGGQILYVGVTLDQAGTSLHCAEDELGLDYMYLPDTVTLPVVDAAGQPGFVETLVHNPIWSAQRRCDGLIEPLAQAGVLQRVRWGGADCLLLEARLMLDFLVRAYRERGVTLYHPEGS